MKNLLPLLLVLFSVFAQAQQNAPKTKVYKTSQSAKSEKNSFVCNYPIEKVPEFPGGETALRNYLKQNLRYPDCISGDVEGTVRVKFLVGVDGSINKVHVIRKFRSGFDEEAVRLIKNMPKWIPGCDLNGNAQDTWFLVPVRFALE